MCVLTLHFVEAGVCEVSVCLCAACARLTWQNVSERLCLSFHTGAFEL